MIAIDDFYIVFNLDRIHTDDYNRDDHFIKTEQSKYWMKQKKIYEKINETSASELFTAK